VVGEAGVGRQAREVAFAGGEPFERVARAAGGDVPTR
jgi:hypothetical protein